MREPAFRSVLDKRIGARSVDSYVAYCRRVERELGVDLDTCDLSPAGLRDIELRLRKRAVAERSLGNCLSALRAYSALDRGPEPVPSSPSPPAPRPRMTITQDQRQAWAADTADGPFNRWLEAQTRNPNGQLDLDRLHALALEYGVDKRDGYAHLNAGQQRMSLGNLLRARVPEALYAYGLLVPTGPAEPPTAESEPASNSVGPAETAAVRLSVLNDSTAGLLALYGEIMDELRRRKVVRTGNSPVGDYAELLFAQAFGWSLEPNSAAGHDATDDRGIRYQIKGRRLSSASASRQLSAIRRLNDKTFDMLAAVLFDPGFKVTRAILIPHEVVARRARHSGHTNGWTFILDDKLWREAGVQDVTAELAVAASSLNATPAE